MANLFSSIVERMVRKSMNEGDFDNLPNAGKPLKLDHMAKDPTMATLLKNYNAKPPAVILNQQIREGNAHLQTLTDEAERKAQMKVLADLQMRYAMQIEAYNKYG
jgi:hypothetical protein